MTIPPIPQCGVNVNHDGDPIGLWFDPSSVDIEQDVNTYVALTRDQLVSLATEIMALAEVAS